VLQALRSNTLRSLALVVGSLLAVGVVCSGARAATAAPGSVRTAHLTFHHERIQGIATTHVVGYATVRVPTSWHRDQTGFTAQLSPTCTLTISVGGADLVRSSSLTRALNKEVNERYGGTIVKGTTSSGHGVWGAQIYIGESQLLGATIMKLAPRRFASLIMEVIAAPSCTPADGPSDYGPFEHLLRTARFHAHVVTSTN
jgi:hypothetical protein